MGMRTFWVGLCLCLLLPLLAPAAVAAEETLDLSPLEDAAGEYAPEVDWELGVDWDKGLENLLDTGTGQVFGVLQRAMKSGVLLLVIVLFCSLAEGTATLGGGSFQAVNMVGMMAVCAVSVNDIHSLMGLGRETIQLMEGFGTLLLPTLAAAAAAGGTPASAAARQMATLLFSDLLLQLISKVLIPLTYLYVAVCAAHAAIGNGGLKRIAKTLKGFITGCLTAMLLVFGAYLTVSGVIAGSTDALSVKTAKLAISGMVPVVGGVLSDAAETVLASAGILRNAIGVFGMLVILGMCVAPFLQMGVHYLVYKLTATLAGTISEGKVVELVENIGEAFALELGMVASCGMLLLFGVISCLNAAGAV